MENRTLTIALIFFIVLGILGYVIYHLNQPIPLDRRLDDAASDIGRGNFGEAMDSLRATTPAERISETVNDTVNDTMNSLSPTQEAPRPDGTNNGNP